MARLPEELQHCFPADGPIWAYMQWAHRLTHTPPILHLASILPVMSYELCRRGFNLGPFGAPRVWFGIVAASSIGKTQAFNDAREFADSWYEEHFVHEALRPKPWVSLEGSLPGVLHAISTMTNEHGRTSGIFHHSEFSRVLRADDALEPLNMIYDGKSYDRNLRYLQKQQDAGERVNTTIKSPAFSAIVTTTPSAISHTARPDMVEGGLFQRILWLRTRLERIDLQPRKLEDDAGRQRALEVWAAWFGYMEALRVQAALSATIRMSQEATDWLDTALFHSLTDLLIRESFDASVAMRALPQATHIAAIYAASRLTSIRGGVITIEHDDVVRAANLVAICLRHAKELGNQLLSKVADLNEKQQRLLDAVIAADVRGLTRDEIYRVFNRHVDRGQVEEMIRVLSDCDLAVEEVSSINQRGRPVRKLWAIEAWRRLRQNTN